MSIPYKEFKEIISDFNEKMIGRYIFIDATARALKLREDITSAFYKHDLPIYVHAIIDIPMDQFANIFKDSDIRVNDIGFEYIAVDMANKGECQLICFPNASKIPYSTNSDGFPYLDRAENIALESYFNRIENAMIKYTDRVERINYEFSTLNSSEYTDGRDAHMSILENIKKDCLKELSKYTDNYRGIDISGIDYEKLIDNISITMDKFKLREELEE